jgi:hypothetical protein
MEAKTKKNQSKVNKCIKALQRYYALNTLRDIADNDGNEKEVKKYDRQCEEVYSRYLDCLQVLPKYEQKIIDKLIF